MSILRPVPNAPHLSIEVAASALTQADLNDLCDATELAIAAGGGFGWVKPPSRDRLERHWQGVLAMPNRRLFLARLDGVICGTCQLAFAPAHNEAQAHAVTLSGHFVTPWARGNGHSRRLLHRAEDEVRALGLSVINLDVRETQAAAIKLYETEGYQLIGTHPFYAYIDGSYVAGRYYTKCLAEEEVILAGA